MQSVRRRDTEPERAVRRELHRRGLRFRIDVAPVAGLRTRVDIVFRRARVAVLIDGCFWHCCPLHRTRPAANAKFWHEKLAANVARDRRMDRALRESGWTVLRFWEHEDPARCADRIGHAVSRATPP